MIYVKDQGVWKEVGGGLPKAPGPLRGEPYGGGYALNGFYYEVFGNNEIIITGGPGADGYLYIIADKSAEALLQWKTFDTSTSGTSSETDGWANTNAMNNTNHPAAKYCRDYRGGGFDDWYLPARDELNLFWINIAPGRSTTPIAFQTGGAQALTVPDYYWSSTQASTTSAWRQGFSDGNQIAGLKTSATRLVRPVRRIIL